MTADLSNLVVEILHKRDDDNHPYWSVGSGFFVSSRLVLTALHIVDGMGELLVRVHGTEEHPAVVRLQGDRDIVDLAVLEVPDVAVDVPPLRYGEVVRSAPAVVERCWAVGFPHFKVLEHERGKPKPPPSSAQVDGEIPIGENLGQPLLTLRVRNSPRPLPSGSVRESEWEGMSGAVVFSGDYIIVGVITEHRPLEGESALTVVPITALDQLPEAEATKWWKLLGVDHQALVRLPSDEREQRLRSQRSRRCDFYQYISPPIRYVSRQEVLDTVRSVLLADLSDGMGSSPSNRPLALHGMGGIGKSIIARALCDDPAVQTAFPDGILWVTLGKEPELVSAMRQWVQVLGGTISENVPTVDSLKLLKDLLAKLLKDRICLLIVDDVWRHSHAEAFSVGGPRCRMLLTTRDTEIVSDLGAKVQPIPGMTEAEAITLLEEWSDGHLTEADLKLKGQIVKRLGYLPLAVKLAGAQLRRKQAGEWLQTFALRNLKSSRPEGIHDNLELTFNLSLEELDKDPHPLRRLYVSMAIFKEDEEIPQAAIERLWYSRDGFDAESTADILDNLAARALLDVTSHGYSKVVRLHDLLHDLIDAELNDERIAVHQALLKAYHDTRKGDGWHTVDNDGYFFGHLAYHLIGAARKEELRALLLDFNWLQARLEASDFTGLIADYKFLSEDAVLSLLRDALRLSAHVLAQDKTQLAGQLLGRLLTEKALEIQGLLEQTTHWESVPWLRPLRASLPSPGGLLLRTMTGHTEGVTALAVTPDGLYALSGSWDHTLKMWDVTSGQLLHTMVGHTDGIRTLAMTPDAGRAISSSWDCTIRVWDIKRETELYKLPGCEDNEMEHLGKVAISPDGQRAVSVLYNGSGTSICVWDLAHGTNLHTLSAHTDILRVIIMPDGRRTISCSNNGTLIMWDMEGGKQLSIKRGPTEGVTAVTPDGKCAVSVTHDGTLSVWDLENGAELFTLHSDPKWRDWSRWHGTGMEAVAITPDGRRAVSASDGTFILWDLEKKKELRTLIEYTTGVMAVVAMPDGRHIISASEDKTLKLWDLERGVEQHPDHVNEVSAIVFMQDEPRVVSTSDDGTLIAWDAENGKKLREFKYTNSVEALLPDGRRAISTLRSNITVWDIESGDELQIMKGHTDNIIRVVVAPDGQRVVSVTNNGDLIVWDLKSGSHLRRLSGQRGVMALIPGGWRAVSASEDFNLKVWDMESEEELYMLRGHTHIITTVAVTPDGRRAVSGSYDRTLKVWDLEKGEMITSFLGESKISACNISQDGLTIVGGEILGRVHFLRLEGV